jgi:signal peptidase II
LTYNTGAAFSFLADAGGWQRWFFIGLAFVVSAWCWRWIGKEADGRIRLALCLVIAGAIGNVIDRIWLGKVIDFVLIYWQPWNFYYPAFNVADSAICIGAAIMIWSAIFVRKDTAAQ